MKVTRADVTASYTGKAAGISVRDKTSGHFTADVDLTATFGESPMLGGTISGFDGKAANPEWNVMLDDTALGGTAAIAADRRHLRRYRRRRVDGAGLRSGTNRRRR